MDEFEKRLRAAFEERPEGAPPPQDLRRRVIANAVRTPRHRQGLLLRWTPAVALLAIVVIAGGVLNFRERGPNAPRPGPTASAPVAPAFGVIPVPALNPPQGLGGGDGGPSRAAPYFGPADLHWAGQLPSVPTTAPVIRFPVATDASADAFAASLGARPAQSSPGAERQYVGPGDYQMSVRHEDLLAPPDRFTLSRGLQRGTPALDQTQAEAAAAAELARLKLTPSWQAQVSAARSGGQGLNSPSWTDVLYAREVSLPSGQPAAVVNNLADPAGTSVRVEDGGRVDRIEGYLPAAEDTAPYGLENPARALQAALTAPPAVAAPSGPAPVVQLTQARLVYLEASAGGYGYLEPAYLFTGTFTRGGVLYEKRILVPAVSPAELHS